MGILSLICGIVGMCSSCIVIGIIPCILSLIFGAIALLDGWSNKWPSICGLVCSGVGIAMFALVISQTDSYRLSNVATPTEIAENLTNNEDGQKANRSNQNETPRSNTNADTRTSKKEEPKQDSESQDSQHTIDMKFDSFSATYVSHEVSTDYDGKPCVIIYYDFTNNTDEPISALTVDYMQVYQNGIQCDSAIISDNNEYINNYSKNVMKGTTIRVGRVFSIYDTSDIEVVMEEAFSFSDKSDSMTIKLN